MGEFDTYPGSNNLYRFRLIFLFFLISWFFSAFLPGNGYAQDETAAITADQLEWKTETIAEGIVWKRYRGDDLYDARLSINLVKVDLDKAPIQFKIAHVQDQLIKTSEFADEFGAVAAVNGSFFNMDSGGSVVFLKVDGEVIANGAAGRNPYTESGAIGWGEDQIPRIIQKPADGWRAEKLTNILSSGPLLIHNGEFREFNNDPFNQNRHPRTAVGITDNNQLIMAAVDGRSFQSYGMTIPELAQFFRDFGAVSALNLDGGGSTAMWIQEKNIDGIVNYPSDNFEFDHEGERGVSNALLLIAN
jgi:exopolysaccharide biosynthesis protein